MTDQEQVNEEIAFHIEMRAKEYEEQGLSREEALRKAIAKFGDPRKARAEAGGASKVRGRRILVGLLLLLVGVFVAGWATGLVGFHEGRFYVYEVPYAKLSPFEAVRWEDRQPVVRIEDTWYSLTEIDGLSSGKVVSFCIETWPDRWRKRFEEDIVEVLTRMGRDPDRRVDLVLFHASMGRTVRMDDVPMTEENRRRIWEAADRGALR